LPRTTHRPFALLAAALVGSTLVGAATIPALAAGPFGALSGAWGGNGTIQPGNGTTERIRCNANYRPRGSSGTEIDIDLRCASDSYNFDLTGNVRDRDGMISGQWSEATRNASGTIEGRAAGDHIEAAARGQNFSANLSLTTRGNRQTVSIHPAGTDVRNVSLTLARR